MVKFQSQSLEITSEEIICTFDGIEVNGTLVNSTTALCVSPQLSRTGQVPFVLRVPEINLIYESVFTSCKFLIVYHKSFWNGYKGYKYYDLIFSAVSFTNSFEVYVANEDLVFTSETSVHIQWSPESIFPTDIHGSDMYNVDIELYQMNMDTRKWEMIQCLSSNIENNGSAEVAIPNLSEQTEDNRQRSREPVSAVVIAVGLSLTAQHSTIILEKLVRLGLRTLKYAPIRYLVKNAFKRVACEFWSLTQPENIGDEIKRRLPPCPTRMSVVEAPNSGFREERLSSTVNFVGAIQNYQWTTVIDDAFRTYFHPGTDKCFRQIVTSK